MSTNLDKMALGRISKLTVTGLISLEQVIAWAKRTDSSMECPPAWLTGLAELTRPEEVPCLLAEITGRYQFDAEDQDNLNLFGMACFFFRHDRGELPWTALLSEIAEYCFQIGRPDSKQEYLQLLVQVREADFPDLEADSQAYMFAKFHTPRFGQIKTDLAQLTS